MVGHGGSSAGPYLADPTSPIPSHCASIVVTGIVRVNPCNEISNNARNLFTHLISPIHAKSYPYFIKFQKFCHIIHNDHKLRNPAICTGHMQMYAGLSTISGHWCEKIYCSCQNIFVMVFRH